MAGIWTDKLTGILTGALTGILAGNGWYMGGKLTGSTGT